MARAFIASSLALLALHGCVDPGTARSTSSAIDVTVLTASGCSQTDPAVEQVERVAAKSSIPIRLERIVVETDADARRLHLLGSPTFLVDGRDLEPAARERTDYGFSWRAYGTSAVPPEEMVERALREAIAARDRVIVVEATGFGWSAVAGLGWGSRLAPVLAQLESIRGVSEVRVDWTGRYFLVRHAPTVGTAAVVEGVATILGPTTRRLPAKQEDVQLESFREGAPWLKAGETARLSKHEAETLATRYATTAAQTLGLDPTRTSKIVGIVQDELVAMFKRFESTGLPARAEMMEEWKRMSERVAARSRDSLTESEAERLGEALRTCCER